MSVIVNFFEIISILRRLTRTENARFAPDRETARPSIGVS
jgi:hypothetical protein